MEDDEEIRWRWRPSATSNPTNLLQITKSSEQREATGGGRRTWAPLSPKKGPVPAQMWILWKYPLKNTPMTKGEKFLEWQWIFISGVLFKFRPEKSKIDGGGLGVIFLGADLWFHASSDDRQNWVQFKILFLSRQVWLKFPKLDLIRQSSQQFIWNPPSFPLSPLVGGTLKFKSRKIFIYWDDSISAVVCCTT
jgi:hypothetical protein